MKAADLFSWHSYQSSFKQVVICQGSFSYMSCHDLSCQLCPETRGVETDILLLQLWVWMLIKIPVSHVSLAAVLYRFSWIRILFLLCMLSLKRISFQWLSCTNKGHMNTKQRYPHLSLFSAHGPLTFTLRGGGQCVPSSLKPLVPTAYFLGVHGLGFTHCRVNVWLGEVLILYGHLGFSLYQCSEWALV